MRMRNIYVIRAGLIILLASTFQASAGTEEYPGAYFEPKVLYQAPEIKAAPPAEPAQEQSSPPVASNATSQPAEADPNYPGAYFSPKVVYQDPKLIAATTQPAVPAEDSASAEPNKEMHGSQAASSSTAISDSSPPYGVLLLVVGVLGLVYWWSVQQKKKESADDSSSLDPVNNEEAFGGNSGEEAEEDGDDALEALAEAATTKINRHRANKTKRSRRR